MKDLIKRIYALTLNKPIKAMHKIFRKATLSRELRHISKQELINDIDSIGFPYGAVVFVHSSLKRIGFVDGGADAILGALIEVIVNNNKGTLALPAFSIIGTMHSTMQTIKSFDVRRTPTNMGALPRSFAKMRGVKRSIHPTHSVFAMGSLANWLTEEHLYCGTNFGPGSPLHKLIESDGYICGIGTHLGTVTFYHVLEDTEPDFPLQVYSDDSPFEIICKDVNGMEHMNTYYSHKSDGSRTRIDSPNNPWIRNVYTRYFEKYGDLQWHKIGETKAWTIKASDMYRCMNELCNMNLTIYTIKNEVNLPAKIRELLRYDDESY